MRMVAASARVALSIGLSHALLLASILPEMIPLSTVQLRAVFAHESTELASGNCPSFTPSLVGFFPSIRLAKFASITAISSRVMDASGQKLLLSP